MKRILLLLLMVSIGFGQWSYDYSKDPMEASILGDVNLIGNHLLNDQTTTNMMSKGTAYRFDGVNDLVTVTANATITNIFDSGGSVVMDVYPLSDGEGDAAHILNKRTAGAGWQINVSDEVAGYMKITFLRDRVTTDGTWITTSAVLPINTWSNIVIVYDDSAEANNPVLYLNGISVALTESTTPSGTATSDVSENLTIGNKADGSKTWDGSISEVKLFNTALTASEVKDLSANTPYKWQGASQTSLSTGTFADYTPSFDTFSGASATGFHAEVAAAGAFATTLDDISVIAGNTYKITFTAVADVAGDVVNMVIRQGRISGAAYASIANVFTTSVLEWTATVTEDVTIYFSNGAGTTVNYTVSNFSVVQLGVVADYPSYAISDATWHDVSGNANDGTVTGASVQHYKGIHSDGTDAYVDNDFSVAGTSTFGGDVILSATATLEVASDGGFIAPTQTPSGAGDTGTTGQIAWDADFIYVCTATDTWKRTAIATW